jgi:hypothetical protein
MERNESRIKHRADERERPGNAAVSIEDPLPMAMSLDWGKVPAQAVLSSGDGSAEQS